MSCKIAFIGAGRMANVHAPRLKKISGVEISGVFDTAPGKSQKFSEDYGAKIYSSQEALLAEKTFDAIFICHYAYDHVSAMIKVMEAGFKNIFCEKPVTRDPGEIALLRSAVAKYSPRIMIGHHRKHFNCVKKIKEILESGRLGKIHYFKVHCCNPAYSRDWNDYFASYARSGGTTLDMTTHYLDLLCWFFGEAASVSAQAVMLEKTLSKDVDPFDYVNGTVTYRNGVFGGIEASYQRYGDGLDELELYGDKYTLITDFATKVELKNKAETIRITFQPNDPYDQQMVEFAGMIQDGIERHTTLEEGIAATECALAMLESCEKGGELIRF